MNNTQTTRTIHPSHPIPSMATNQHHWKVVESYYQQYDLTSLQVQSYNQFVLLRMSPLLRQQSFCIEYKDRVVHVTFQNVYCDKPIVNKVPLYPNEARQHDLTYDTAVMVDMKTTMVDKSGIVHQSCVLPHVELFRLPVMVRSCLCNNVNDCSEYNEGGFFIVKGNERVLIAQERINYNQVYVYKHKIKYKYVAEIRSVKEGADYSVLFQVKLQTDDRIVCSIPYITKDIPLYILFSVMGVSNNFIMSYVKHDKYVYLAVKQSMDLFTLSREECINYLSQYVSNKAGEKAHQYVKQIIKYELLPHFNVATDPRVKAVFIMQMISKLIQTNRGARPEDDRDHICNKRVESAGELLENLIHGLLKKAVKQVVQHLEKKDCPTRIDDLNIPQLIAKQKVSQRILQCFSTGNWGVPNSNYIRQGVSQILNRLSYVGMVSHLQRIVVPIGKESRNTQVRQIHCSSYGFIDPVETPEGQTVGIIKNFAIMTRISVPVPTTYIVDLVDRLFPQFKRTYRLFGTYCCLYVNGLWIGSIKECHICLFITQFKHARALRIIPEGVSIGWNRQEHEVYIYSDSGRILRPVIVTSKLPELYRLAESHTIEDLWVVLRDQNVIAFIDGNEAEYSYIQMTPTRESSSTTEPYDYTEIHPSLMLGVCSNLTPYPEHSQAPRNVYVAAMMKQAIGVYSYSLQQRYDTIAHVLNYPQRKLVTTQLAQYCHMDDMPSGQEAVVAVMCYTGFNQEDSILMNKSAIDRGLFGSTSYRTVSTQETKKSHYMEIIEQPPEALRVACYNYDILDENGIVPRGTIVKKNDVLVGRVQYNKNVAVADCSLVITKTGEEGYVEHIIETTNAHGYKLVKVRVCVLCTPEVGDKFCQVSAQKGTIGMVYNQEDMPFTGNGMTPDIIINPHAFPSRMTVNMLMEMLAGKAGCMTGTISDASAFECDGTQLVREAGDVLRKAGYDPLGTEVLYNGFTGEPMEAQIFMGPAYYQRLKHLVASKIHGRSFGNVQLLSRQPCAGRSRDGGLRFGEMERDCAIVHGISSFQRERLFDLSDPYTLRVCSKCNIVTTSQDKCKHCSHDQTTEVHIPYACKLMFQNLEAMAIKIQMKPHQ